MISHRHKCLYVKVPKCASTTALDWFSAHGGGWHSFKPWWYGGLLSERIQGVAQAMNLYPDYLTFTFVRNPYERFVSTWLHTRRIVLSQTRFHDVRTRPDDYGTLREFAELCGELHGDFGLRWGRDARDFFQANAEREYGPRKIKLKYLGFVVGHARPQTDFLPDCHPERLFGVKRVNGNPLSLIGTVENIEADFSRLAEMLRLPDAVLPDCNSSGIGTRAGDRERYTSYYDTATRRLVEEIYASDLAFTGCGFPGGRTAIAVSAPRSAVAVRQVKRRRSWGTFPARAWRRLWSLEVRIEERVLRSVTTRCLLRSVTVRRLLRPLRRLRSLPC